MEKHEIDIIIHNIKLIILSPNRCAQNNALDKAQRIYDYIQDPVPESIKQARLDAIEEEIEDYKAEFEREC